ncbi:hypothetical protein [Endozoicomonas elysicola]|uniref:Uncharacterized protein n=1 Tax=Endozoicomonas elysicola TaxID=305900 RepID=A0A081KAY0_9GAMM|nr:hypothetical protein [Endozoicomonas elysicola]KEI71306.1 hypothetical protein GV64_11665 [Endozoicomonas elysicola]
MNTVGASHHTASPQQVPETVSKSEVKLPDNYSHNKMRASGSPCERGHPSEEPLISHKISPRMVDPTQGMSEQLPGDGPGLAFPNPMGRNEVGPEKRSSYCLESDGESGCEEGTGLKETPLERKHNAKSNSDKQSGLDVNALLMRLENLSETGMPEEKCAVVCDVAVSEEAENNETGAACSGSYRPGDTKSAESEASDSEYYDSDTDCSDFDDDFSKEYVLEKLGRFDRLAFNASPDHLQQLRSELADYMKRATDLSVIDVRDLKENVEELNALYKNKFLFDRAGVSEPFVLVKKMPEINGNAFVQHRMKVSKLFELIQCSAIYDKLIAFWRQLEFALPARDVPTRPMLVLHEGKAGSRLLLGLPVYLNKDGLPVVLLVDLDAQATAWSNLRKKLISELDACIAVKCWQKHNPDYAIKMEIDLNFENLESSVLTLELIGINHNMNIRIAKTCSVFELFDVASGEVCFRKFFSVLNQMKPVRDDVTGSPDDENTAFESNGLPDPGQTIFHLKLT